MRLHKTAFIIMYLHNAQISERIFWPEPTLVLPGLYQSLEFIIWNEHCVDSFLGQHISLCRKVAPRPFDHFIIPKERMKLYSFICFKERKRKQKRKKPREKSQKRREE